MEAAGAGYHVDQNMDSEPGQNEVPEEGLPRLSNCLLLHVFEHLTLPELFSARVVCKRWSKLALHPAVWRHRELPGTGFGQKPKKGVLRAALARAPRAKSLRLNEAADLIFSGWGSTSSIFDDGGVLADLAVKTDCGVESLDVLVKYADVEKAARILENQATLGRTRKLRLSILQESSEAEAPTGERWKDLLAALCAMKDLTELHLNIYAEADFDLAWMPELDAGRKSSLRTLRCDFSSTTWAVFMGRLMEWHAPTLESVCLSGSCDEGSVGLPPSCWSASLAKTTRLRELDCPMLPDMAESLLQCSELQTLTLRFDPDFRRGSAVWREARRYLWKAKGLRALTLWGWATNMYVDYGQTALPAVDLVEALAYSNQPTLEVLECRLGDFDRDNLYLLDRLLAIVLGHLPALRHLCVYPSDYEAMSHLLDRLSRAPRTLTVHVQSDRACFHEWVWLEAASVKACFDRNPGLHLRLTPFGSGVVCDACKDIDYGSRKNDVVVYGHPDDVQCDHSQPDTDYILHALPGEVVDVEAAAAQ